MKPKCSHKRFASYWRTFFFQVKLISGPKAPPAAPVPSMHPATIARVAYHRVAAAAAQLRPIDALNADWNSIAQIVSITKLIIYTTRLSFLKL